MLNRRAARGVIEFLSSTISTDDVENRRRRHSLDGPFDTDRPRSELTQQRFGHQAADQYQQMI